MATLTPESGSTSVVFIPRVRPTRTPTSVWWGRIRRSPQLMIGTVIVSVFVLCSVFAPALTSTPPDMLALEFTLQPPSPAFPMGTDELGRNVLVRILYGGQVSLQVSLIAVSIGLVTGVLLGLIAGYVGGAVDTIIMRTMDALQAFPAVLLAIVIASVLGSGVRNAMIAIGIVSIPGFARLMRSQVLQLKNFEYVQAARALGATDLHIIFRHIFPNGTAPIIVSAALASAGAILTEASLSFVGLGATPPMPSWGGMLQKGYPFLAQAPWLSIFPGLVISITVLGLNFLGDGLRDILDPKLRGR